MTRDELRAYAMLATTAFCWGLNANFSRLAVGEISPLQLVAFRWTGVVLLLLLFARQRLRRDWPELRPHWRYIAAMGLSGFTVFTCLIYIAGHHTTAINIGIIQGAMPVFILLGALLAFGNRITLLQSIGVAVTLAGVIIVSSGGTLGRLLALSLNDGDLIMLLACLIYAGYSLGLHRRPASSALGLFAAMAACAALGSYPLLALEIAIDGWQAPTPAGWLIAVLVTLLPSLVAQVFFIQGVAIIGPGRAGVFVNLTPVIASMLAVILVGEAFYPYHGIALLLVLGGIAIAEHGKPNP